MVAYMPGARLSYQAAEAVTLALAVVLAGILALIGYRRWIRSRCHLRLCNELPGRGWRVGW